MDKEGMFTANEQSRKGEQGIALVYAATELQHVFVNTPDNSYVL